MRKLFAIISAAGIMSVTCLMFFCDLGDSPIGPEKAGPPPSTNIDPSTGDTIRLDSISNTMSIYVSPSKLRANNTDTAEVVVSVYDSLYHNPIAGQVVYFRTTHGVITSADTTDARGIARAILKSIPINAEARVIAWIFLDGVKKEVGQTVTLSGLEITLVPQVRNQLVNIAVPVTVEVVDAGGQPVPGATITLGGALSGTLTTKGDGTATTSITSSRQDSVVFTASGLGASAVSYVKFWAGSIPAGTIDEVNAIRRIRIFSSKSQLKADNTDNAVITVILTNENNNPAAGQQISFSCNLGVIGSMATVDSSGRASVILRSAPINGVCRITAQSMSNPSLQAAIDVAFAGVSLNLSAEPTSLRIGQYSNVSARLTDASGAAIGGDTVIFTVTGGRFSTGDTSRAEVTDPSGNAAVQVTASSTGTVRVRGSALNASDTISIIYTTNACSLWAVPPAITADGISTATLYARYIDGSGNPLANQTISFATNAGTVTPSTAVTNASGVASVLLTSAPFVTGAIVQATAPNGSALDTIYFYSSTAARVSLAVTPDNISYNGGRATLTATVTDAKGNMVTGAAVNFKIIKGPGGGEYIVKPVVVSQDGIATSTLVSGSITSSYRGCEVAAYVGDLADSSKLTISGKPHIITVSRPEDDTVTVPKAGQMDESTFEFFVGAVVQDINGNPVADNTEVHFSAVVSGLQVCRLVLSYWQGVGGGLQELKAVLAYSCMDIMFEDMNNNHTMDANIDLKLDFNDAVASRGDDVNGDGTCEYVLGTHDFFYDFNGNGRPDISTVDSMGRPGYYGEPYYVDLFGDHHKGIYADLNQNGYRDLSEFYPYGAYDFNKNGICDLPASGDFRFSLWEMRPMWRGERLNFENNDFAVVIDASVPTKGGVAYARITYPRQFANRLIVTINAEANGIRDKDGERFTLPVVR